MSGNIASLGDVDFSDIPLRSYQRTIASLAVTCANGVGCVVNLPTGAGKTNVAGAISFHELSLSMRQGRTAATVMIVPTRDLVLQQANVFRKLLPNHVAVAYKLGNTVQTCPLEGKMSSPASTTMVFVATAAMYERNVRDTDPEWICGSGLPPLDITTTVFFDEVHHCNKLHPFAVAASAIFKAVKGASERRPRIVGLSATLSYSTDNLIETKSLLSMMRCGSGTFSNYPGDPYSTQHRAFIFTRPTALLVEEGYQCSGSAKALPQQSTESNVTVSNLYKIYDLESHRLWQDMGGRLSKITGGLSFEEALARSEIPVSETLGVHYLVSATYVLSGYLESLILRGSWPQFINSKYDVANEKFKSLCTMFVEKVVEDKTTSTHERVRVTSDLRLISIYLHCMQLLRLVTVTSQGELESALRGFVMFLPTSVPPLTDQDMFAASLEEARANNPALCLAEKKASALQKEMERELLNNKDLAKFEEVFELLKGRVRRGALSIVFAESVPICGILAEYLNLRSLAQSTPIRSQWYTSQTGSPYFNISHRSPTFQKVILNNFREERINVLVGTTVLEEGIDVPHVQFTVHFTLPNNVVSQVQRKGRARAAESESYVMDNSRVGILEAKERQHLRHKDQIQCIALDPNGADSSTGPVSFSPIDSDFRTWLRFVKISEERPSTQVLNELSQKLKSSGKVTQSTTQVVEQKFRGSVTIEIHNKVILKVSVGKGKRDALEQAATGAIHELKEFLRC